MVHVMHVLFVLFVVSESLKASVSYDNLPVYALDVFKENATKMVGIDPLNRKARVTL